MDESEAIDTAAGGPADESLRPDEGLAPDAEDAEAVETSVEGMEAIAPLDRDELFDRDEQGSASSDDAA